MSIELCDFMKDFVHYKGVFLVSLFMTVGIFLIFLLIAHLTTLMFLDEVT